MSARIFVRPVLVILAVVLAGCSSVPLGTMWKLSRMGPEALYRANPEEVRAAVRSAEWVLEGPSFDQGMLQAELRSALHGDRSWEFTLQETSAREAWQLPEPADGQRWRIYRIAESQLDEFQAFQHELPSIIDRRGGEDDEAEISLSVQFMSDALETSIREMAEDDVAMRTETVVIRIDLRLDAQDGYFTLLNDHEMDVQLPEILDIDAE